MSLLPAPLGLEITQSQLIGRDAGAGGLHLSDRAVTISSGASGWLGTSKDKEDNLQEERSKGRVQGRVAPTTTMQVKQL